MQFRRKEDTRGFKPCFQTFVEVESSGFRGFLHNKKVSNSGVKEKEFSTSVFNIYNCGQSDQYSLSPFTQRGGNAQTVNMEIIRRINPEEFSQINGVLVFLDVKKQTSGLQ